MKFLVLTLLGLLAACNNAATETTEPGFGNRLAGGQVVQAAKAPDGTVLWAVKPPGTRRVVYFSSRGTQTSHSENCGKSCTRTVDDEVPAAP